jgi:nucleoside-diphosphate-sugar epimerase
MNTILVTGSSGFVGQAICRVLSEKYKVIALYNMTLPGLGDNCIPVRADITDGEALKTVCETYKPDMVVHCAGIAHQKLGSVSADQYMNINSIATETLAKAAAVVNPDVHFIFLSSISVYGEAHFTNALGEDGVCMPSSDYAFSKRDAENRLENLHRDGILKKIDILRLAPVYDSEWSLNLERRVFAPKKCVYLKFGSGEQEMSAVSRFNLVDFIDYRIKNGLKERRNGIGDLFSNTFNVCDEKPYKFTEIIRVFKISGHQPDRFVLTVPLGIVWVATRLAGFIIKNKRKWFHSCYDKLAYSLVFDNTKMLETDFKPKQTIESVFLKKNS